MLDRGNPVGHNQRRLALPDFLQVLQDPFLRIRIHSGKCVVQNQDRRILHQRPGNGDALLLPAGDGHATLSEHRPVSLRKLHDIVMHVRSHGCSLHRFRIRFFHAEGNVVFNGIGKKERILRDVGDIPVEHLQGNLPKRMSVDPDHFLPVRIPQPFQQVHDACFSRAGSADNGKGLSPGYLYGYILQGGMRRRSSRVREAQMVQHNISAQGGNGRIPLIPDFRLLLQDQPDPPQGGRSLGEIGYALPHGDHGPDQHRHITVESHELSQCDFSVDRHPPAENQCQQKR